MNRDKTYELLLNKMHEVTVVPSQQLGGLTPLYKKIVPFFKFYPWRSAFIISLIGVLFLYLLLGSVLIRVASILQISF